MIVRTLRFHGNLIGTEGVHFRIHCTALDQSKLSNFVKCTIIWSMTAMLRDTTVVAVVRTRPLAIPLPIITMRKSIHGFLSPYMVIGLRLVTLRAAGAPLLIKYALSFARHSVLKGSDL